MATFFGFNKKGDNLNLQDLRNLVAQALKGDFMRNRKKGMSCCRQHLHEWQFVLNLGENRGLGGFSFPRVVKTEPSTKIRGKI